MSTEKLEFQINYEKIKGKKIALICSQFNQDITESILAQTEEVLKEYAIEYSVYKVPGAFEIPYRLSSVHEKYDAFVAIGCLIKGETMHFEYIAGPVSQSLLNLSVELNKPIGFGVATCLTKEQAEARLNLGAQATKTVLQLLSD